MPFVKQECRDALHVPCSVGDLCYREYVKLIAKWNADPRWTTAHNITKEWFDFMDDEGTAHFLAWMVWFNKKVMQYEDQKEKDNGTI